MYPAPFLADSVLIDIPIGLSDSGPGGRLCDREARQLLGCGRVSSVFSAPARRTLQWLVKQFRAIPATVLITYALL